MTLFPLSCILRRLSAEAYDPRLAAQIPWAALRNAFRGRLRSRKNGFFASGEKRTAPKCVEDDLARSRGFEGAALKAAMAISRRNRKGD